MFRSHTVCKNGTFYSFSSSFFAFLYGLLIIMLALTSNFMSYICSILAVDLDSKESDEIFSSGYIFISNL